MKPSPIFPDLFASPRIAREEVAEAKAAGFRSLLCNRPDGEAADQPPFAVSSRVDVDRETLRHGLIHDPRPSRLAWTLETRVLRPPYWNAMLKGRELLVKPRHAPTTAGTPS